MVGNVHDDRSASRVSRSTLRQILKLLVSAGMIAVLAYWVDWPVVGQAVARAEPIDLLVAMLFIAPTVALAAWRWACCARASSIEMSPGFYLKATYSALFVGQFLPAGLGVDAARLAYFMHGRARLAHALQSLALDRAIGVISVIFVMAGGLPLIWNQLPPLLRLFSLALIAATIGGILAILLLDRVGWLTRYSGIGKRRKLIDLALAVRASLFSVKSLEAFGISCLIYCLMILGVFWIARGIGVSVDYLSLLAIVSLAMFVASMPVSVNGWGVREGAMVAGLSALGVSREAALAISLMFGFINAVVTIPGAFVWHAQRRQVAAHPSNREMESSE